MTLSNSKPARQLQKGSVVIAPWKGAINKPKPKAVPRQQRTQIAN